MRIPGKDRKHGEGRAGAVKNIGSTEKGSRTLPQDDNYNPNFHHTAYLWNIVILCVITLLCIAFSLILGFRYIRTKSELARAKETLDEVQGENKQLYTADEVDRLVSNAQRESRGAERRNVLAQIQSSLESGKSTVSMLRSLFSEDIVVVNGGRYYFYPELDDVAQNRFESGDFTTDDAGMLSYQGSDADHVKTARGIDISESTGNVKWNELSEDEVSFVMICAGGRDENGTLRQDSMFRTNMSGAIGAGLDVGVYYRFEASTKEEAKEDAEYLLDLLSDYDQNKITYPVAITISVPDVEDRTISLTRNDWTQNCITFCNTIAAKGYTPMIYSNLAGFTMLLDLEQLEDYDKWISEQSQDLYYPYAFSIWQYQSGAQVQGIEKDVNLDLYISDQRTEEPAD